VIEKNMTISSQKTLKIRPQKLPPLSSARRRGITFLAFLGVLAMCHDLFLGLNAAEPHFSFMSFKEACEAYTPSILNGLRGFFGETFYWGLITPLFSLPMTITFLILSLIAWALAMRNHIKYWTPLLKKPEPTITHSSRAIWDERLENEVRKMREAKKDKES
jgi:hypothetical protein